jgi:small GTP-binding protein
MSDNAENEIKVILVGESGTGKTSLINATMGLKFQEHLETTASNNFSSKKITINNKEYVLNLWDTIGQEKFRSLTKIFIKDSKIVLLVYDITVLKTFKELDYWYKIIHDILGDEPVVGICGNKQDLISQEQVKEEDAKKYAEEKNLPFKLTSAKNPFSFNKFLEEMVKKYVEKSGGKVGNDTKQGGGKINISDKNQKEKKKCC